MIKAAAGWQTNVAGRKGSYEGVFVGAFKVCSFKSCKKFVEDSIAESPFSSIQHCLKGGYRKFVLFFHRSRWALYMVGKSETGRSDLKMVKKKCKDSTFFRPQNLAFFRGGGFGLYGETIVTMYAAYMEKI